MWDAVPVLLCMLGTDSEKILGEFDKLGVGKHGVIEHYHSEGILCHLRKSEQENESKREEAWGGGRGEPRMRKWGKQMGRIERIMANR